MLLTIRNTADHLINLILEPWGGVYELGPGEQLELILTGPHPRAPEVDYGRDLVVVWAWPGCSYRMFKNGDELEPESAPVPPTPPGQSVRGFLRALMGGPE